MSKEPPPVRDVIPFKSGKRQSTFRRLNLEFAAGTALEEALARQEQQTPDSNTPVTPVTTGTPVTPVTPVIKDGDVKPEDAAPKKDFSRVANSVVRAIPAGLYSGKGKQLYDFLYSQTRGAIIPKRSVRLPTERVMKGAGMTRHTYRAHMERFVHAGLLDVEERPGEHGGNIYTVYLPDETYHRGDRGDRGHSSDSGQDLPVVQGSEIDRGDRGISSDRSITSGEPKTLIKTKDRSDDEPTAFSGLNETLGMTVRELTGREPSAAEVNRWRELGEVLAAELRIAAARTTVSNVPAFLAEHLRRRLWKLDKKQAREQGRELPDQAAASPGGETAPADCPDCKGSGWWYPEGQEKGVAKCKHRRVD